MWLIDFLASILPGYRAAADASHGIYQDGAAVNHYLTCLVIDKARRDRERHNTQP
jgi:hypothetical protein